MLLQRPSLKQYHPQLKITPQQITPIFSNASPPPSPINIHPSRFLLIHSPQAKHKIAPLPSFNHTHPLASSALIPLFYHPHNTQYI
ncbi:nitroreductase family protein, partial [Paenibacillus xylanexedens]|uniref:nitroreductase family protein n=1 Tax=Paenibacillus xylanexedens TaxID=528191 RepID=UPI0034D97805